MITIDSSTILINLASFNTGNEMKQAVYILGVIAGLSFVIGLYFLDHHWAGADKILTLATISSVIFIPLFAIYQYGKDKN
jgi:hypothetical protein